MLIQFNVTNYMSIKDEIVLSTKAINSDKEHQDYLISNKKDNYLPSIAIYGANASGKSNINKALTSAIMFVRNSQYKQINEPTGFVPFLLDNVSANEKTKIDFIFIRNNIKYAYGFVLDQYQVYEEYLQIYNSAKPSTIFIRKNVNEYEYTSPSIKSELEQLQVKNQPNRLFLSTAAVWNSKYVKEAYIWFLEDIDTYDSAMVKNNFISLIGEEGNKKEYKEFLLNVLKHADINIIDYEVDVREVNNTESMISDNAINYIFNRPEIKTKEVRMLTKHNIESNNGIEEYALDAMLESNGTQMLFAYGITIYKALKNGKTIVIDELDSGLHPMLVNYIVGLFNNKNTNKNNAQLIFNTHDVSLLDLDVFRRDQIYFTEKNHSNGVTDLYSLSQFTPRKNDNIRKGYMQGRYGAIPIISTGVEW